MAPALNIRAGAVTNELNLITNIMGDRFGSQ